MKPHYEAWLSSHPDRTMAWLCERIADGFDIHHIDGDHGNNDPDNLLLVESADHMRIHGMDIRGRAREAQRQKAEARLRTKMQKGETCYSMREAAMTWREIAIEVYGQNMPAKATNVAKAYAAYHGLPWPVDVDVNEIRARVSAQKHAERMLARRPAPTPRSGSLVYYKAARSK